MFFQIYIIQVPISRNPCKWYTWISHKMSAAQIFGRRWKCPHCFAFVTPRRKKMISFHVLVLFHTWKTAAQSNLNKSVSDCQQNMPQKHVLIPFISIALWNDSNGILKIWNLYNIITCAEQYRNLSFDNLHFTKPNQTLQCNLAHSHHWIEIEYFLFQSIPVICVSIIWCGAPDVVQKNTRTEKYLSLKILRRLPKKIDETDKNRRFGVWMCVWVH